MCKLMSKSVIFREVLSAVSAETEIPTSIILSASRLQEVVDARCLLVYALSRCGYTRAHIAAFVGRTPRSVGYVLSQWSVRLSASRLLRINWENIRKQLGSNAFFSSL
jgi:hypothetical protein